jgi:hypothetical protein
MHHTDLEFDLTTGVRFHPVEIVLSMDIKFAIVLGAPAVAVQTKPAPYAVAASRRSCPRRLLGNTGGPIEFEVEIRFPSGWR